MIYLGDNPVGLNQNVHFDAQDEAAFYGLALAAGDESQINSSNAIGSYTDEAKIKIQKMLGIYQPPWEFIREDTFTCDTEDNFTINKDENGNSFELTDVIMMFETPQQATASAKGQYGQLHFYYNNNGSTTYFASESGAWTQNANAAAHGIVAIVEQQPGGFFFCRETTVTTSSNSAPWRTRYGQGFPKVGSAQGIKFIDNTIYITQIVIPKITGTGHYKLYGKRRVV